VAATKLVLKDGQVRDFNFCLSRSLRRQLLMKRSIPQSLGLGEVLPGLPQAVLDALPEALFIADAATGEIRPVNAAATRWTPTDVKESDTWNLTRLFPELSLTKLSERQIGFLLCRAIDPVTQIRQDVVLHFYQLARQAPPAFELQKQSFQTSSDVHTHLVVLGLRTIDSAISFESSSSHDAFHDAFHDPLTRLPNRRLFHRRLERLVERASRSKNYFAVLFVDLDRFKSVNDRFGHTLGDKILISAARRLVDAVRPQDMVARRDGDEFTILLDDLDRPEDAVGVAQRIVDYVQLPIVVDQNQHEATSIEIGASIGIAIAVDGSITAEELIACADAAMYHAKALSGGVYLARDGLRGYRDALPKRKKPLPR
jgi:diguanylate cyclase (GGDEF)-like protein